MISIRIFNTPVFVTPTVILLVAMIWVSATGLDMYWYSNHGFWLSVLIGFGIMVLLILADFGHAIAHIFSARYAGAPMDEVRITTEQMPHTLYKNNSVSPTVHRLRALGGPIFNLFSFLLSITIFFFARNGSIAWEMAIWSSIAHSMMLIMSLAPFPIVDGGTILKWTLVSKGWSETAAENMCRRVGWLVGITAIGLGLTLIVSHILIIGGVLAAAGVIVIGIAIGIVH